MKQEGLHPVSKDVLRALVHRDGRIELPAAGLESIGERIDALLDDPGLAAAVQSLLALALHLELDRGAAEPAHALMRLVVQRAPAGIARQLAAARGRVDDRRRDVRAAFSRLAAVRVDRAAPAFGARAPRGAVELTSLTAARRDLDPRRALAERRARAR